jgi:chromate transporter
MRVRELFGLFAVFAKIGLCTFGGGYAMFPLLIRELVEKRAWLTAEEFADCASIGQCTPGIIAVNTATFVGYRRAGVPGGIFATLGMVFPSAVIISVIAAVLRAYTDFPAVRHAFLGIRVCVCALILKTLASLWKSSVPGIAAFAVFAAVFVLAALLGLPPAALAVGAAIFGVAFGRLRRRRG